LDLRVSRLLEEEADAGDAGGSGLHAERDFVACDAAEGEEVGVGSEVGGLLEEVEAEAGGDEVAVDAFFEDGAEEEVVEAERGCDADVFEGVAGEAEEGRRESGSGEGFADVFDVGERGAGAEVDAVGADGCSEVGGAVEKDAGDAGGGGVYGLDEAVSEGLELRFGEVFFADLEDVDRGAGEAAGLIDEGVGLFAFIARKQAPVGDGVLQHGGESFLARDELGGSIGVKA